MEPVYARNNIIEYIADQDKNLNHDSVMGIPQDINVGRYRLMPYTISNIDTTSQNLIRYVIDNLFDKRQVNCKMYLSKPFNINYLLYELHNARLAGYSGNIKEIYMINIESKYFETKSNTNVTKKNILYISTDKDTLNNEKCNCIIIMNDSIYIKIQ